MTPSHHALLALLFLALGSCVGSFLNVCIHRIPIRLSLVRPRSRCPRCLTAIRACDNIPVLSWLMLRGKCRHCRGVIPPRYAIVELVVGLLFAGIYLAAVVIAPGDVWEVAGPFRVLVLLLVSWALIGSIVVVALMGYDAGRDSRRLTHGRGIVRQEKALARCELLRMPEPILVQLDDFVGTAGVPQPIARDASQCLVRSDDVDRRRAPRARVAGPRA